jgi:hypothetical protein
MHTQPIVPALRADQIVDFDYFAVEPVNDDIHVGWKRLHDGPEIFYTPLNGGHWVFTRAEDIGEAWLDTEHFSNKGVAMSRKEREMSSFRGRPICPSTRTTEAYCSLFFPESRAAA